MFSFFLFKSNMPLFSQWKSTGHLRPHGCLCGGLEGLSPGEGHEFVRGLRQQPPPRGAVAARASAAVPGPGPLSAGRPAVAAGARRCELRAVRLRPKPGQKPVVAFFFFLAGLLLFCALQTACWRFFCRRRIRLVKVIGSSSSRTGGSPALAC